MTKFTDNKYGTRSSILPIFFMYLKDEVFGSAPSLFEGNSNVDFLDEISVPLDSSH